MPLSILMQICENWGKPGCSPEVSKYRGGQIETGKRYPIAEAPHEKDKLNAICQQCKQQQFWTHENKCAACGGVGTLIKTQTLPKYLYECSKCDTIHTSESELNEF